MPPDLEPASALAAIDMTPVDHPKTSGEVFAFQLLTESWIDETGQHDQKRMGQLIEADRAAVRAPLERRIAELEEQLAKAQHDADYLAGYQADLVAIDRVLDAVNAPHDPEEGASLSPTRIRLMGDRIASLEAALHSAERLADARFTTVQELEHKLDESRERVSEIEGKLALEFEVNSTLTGESNALRAHVAELETLLASAVSPAWVLNQLAGHTFPEQGGAYDFMRKCLDELLPPPAAQKEPL